MAPFYHQAAATLGRIRASAIYRSTLAEMDRMTAADPDLIRRVGSLRIAASPDEMEDCAAQFAAMRADDLPVDRYEGPEGEGLLFPADGVFHPVRRCQALARRLIASGARLFERSAALRIAPGLVETETGRVRAGSVIVAVDGGLETVFPELAGRVRTARLQMLATAPAPDTSFPRPVYYRWGYEYWQQLEDGRIALGGFRDYGGENEWTTDPTPGGRVQRRLEGFLRTHLRVTAPITHRWAASVGYSHAALPLLVEVRRRVWATGGYSGTGNVIGALCGRAAAQIALTGGSAMEIVASD
jgi:glycine/D-amino acid oxidase-like deaminating enzyme